MTERFEIDVEETTQENALFQGDEFICYADDVETIIEKLNELEEDNHDLKFELSKHVGDGEWNIRDITCMAGKFRLEEWGERYHQFYDGDTELEDEAVVIMLLENKNLIEELKKENENLIEELHTTRKNRDKLIKKYNNKIKKLKRDKHIILSTINRFVNKYEEKAEVIRFKKPNTPNDYINQGRLRMLGDLLNVLESHEVLNDE